MMRTQTAETLSAADYQLIATALMQRITAFSESRRACWAPDGKLRQPDALIANYGVVERLFTEQIDEAQKLLERVEAIREQEHAR